MKAIPTILAATALVAVSSHAASAATIVALTGDDRLVTIDTDAGSATGSTFVSGVPGRLLGIDVRPSDGKLYGLFGDGTVATIDPATGAATTIDTLKIVPPATGTVTVDFNPVADAMRIMAADGTNLRTKFADGAVTEDGKHAFAADDMHANETPNVVAGAYTNAVAGAQSTTLYNIDGTIGGLLRQDPPNDGTLKAVGKLTIALGGPVGFDIRSDGAGGNEAWLLSGDTLYAVDLETGAATERGTISVIDGTVRDIAILPEG